MKRLVETLEEWLCAFLRDMDLRNYSERSQDAYRKDLSLFIRWVADEPELNEPGDLTPAALERYQMHLMLRRSFRKAHPRTLTAATRNRHLAELRSFFRFLKKSGRILGNPTADLEPAREPKRLPKAVFTVPEVERYLSAIPTDSPLGLRDRAGVELLYGTGIRRSEFTALRVTDLRLEEGLLHVIGKGDRERIVPMGKAAEQALRAYLSSGRPKLIEGTHPFLFVSAAHGGPLSDQEFIHRLRYYAKQAGIKKRVAFHIFRHSVATHLLQRGADLRTIQTLLGHAKLDTTALYTRIDVTDLQRTLLRCHPREQDPA